MGISFAESSDTNRDEGCIRALESASMFPDSRTMACTAKFKCNQLPIPQYQIYLLENDYTIKQYLYNYPPQIPLDDRYPIRTTGYVFNAHTWSMDSEFRASPGLFIRTNACGDIQMYSYYDPGNDIANAPSLEAIYSSEDFEKNRYDITKAIMQRHPTPTIQMSEFNILLNDIHCNEGLELYLRNYNTPVCLKPHTYETLLERGFNLHQPIT